MTESCVKKFDEKKNQFDNELLKSRIKKQNLQFVSTKTKAVPELIKTQLGVFHDKIPHNEDIQKIFE